MDSNSGRFKKGNIPWNKNGGEYSDATRKKMGLAKLGKPSLRLGTKTPSMAGEKHFNWKGGTSRGYKTGYYSSEYKNWRNAVFEKDNHTCQHCGNSNCYVTAHHIKSFAEFPDLRFDISNGITLCEKCHAKTDNYKGRNKKLKTKKICVQ